MHGERRSDAQERYEAIFRAIARPSRNGLFVCIGSTLLLAFLFGVASSLFERPPDWPAWLRSLAVFVPFGVAAVVIPNVAQLLVVRGDVARAIEVSNAFAVGGGMDYTARTGLKPPVVPNASAARQWLSRGEGHGTVVRARVLIWSGELAAAAQVVAAMPTERPIDAFQRSLLRELVEFVATGSMDLAEPRALLETIPPSPERDLATATLAVEEARLDLAAGRDPIASLARARARLTTLPRGASIRERLRTGMLLSAGVVVGAGIILLVIG